MCFYNDDCDWSAEVVDAKDAPASTRTRCRECGEWIEPGEVAHSIHLQQYECCRLCDEHTRDRWDADWEGEPLTPCSERGDRCNYGEEFDTVRCLNCHKFLNAVQKAELAAGCRQEDSLPPLEAMVEYLFEGGQDEAKKYRQMAEKVYPELVANGYLERLWQQLFGEGKR